MTVCTLVLSFSMVATATTTSRKANLKSYGTIQMEKQDGTVKGVIAAADMEYLADEIDNLENTYKCKTLEGLNGINTYFKADGSVTHNAAESAITTSTANLLTFEQLNNAIKSSQASANAPVASEIVSGKSVWANGNNITGTMPNNGATGKSNLTAGSSYTIPSGFTTGGTVTAASLSSQTQGTATAANLSQGVTAWVNGTKITGTGEDNNSYYNQGYEVGQVKSGVYGGTLLWTNEDPNNSFAAQIINVTNLSNYEYIMVESYGGSGMHNNGILPSIQIYKNNISNTLSAYYTDTYISMRLMKISGNSITFGNGYVLNDASANSSYCIPFKIYGL